MLSWCMWPGVQNREAVLASLREVAAPGYVRRLYLARPYPRPKSAMHCLHVPRFTIFTDGEAEWQIPDGGGMETVVLRRGDGVFILPFGWVETEENPNSSAVALVFWEDYLRAATSARLQAEPQIAWHHSARPLNTSKQALLNAVCEMVRAGEPVAEINAALAIVLSHAVRHIANEEATTVGKSAHTWAMVRNHMREHFHLPLDRNTVGAALRLHPNYLSQLFRHHSSTTFSQYLTELRVANAGKLLSDPRLTVAEVADQCGFRDPGYFTKVFRAHHGIVPSQYRQRVPTEFLRPDRI